MKKDAYYFSHDANAQDDPKCMILIDQLGMEGYGIFWGLVEKLRAEKNYKLPILVCQSFARRWSTSKEKIEAVVRNFGLFVIEDDVFFSLRLQRSMIEKSEKARASVTQRWENERLIRSNTSVVRTNTIKGKESKVKEIKVKEIKVKKSKENEKHEVIKKLFNSTCEKLPKVQIITDKRISHIDARIKDGIDFNILFQKVNDSKFLCGVNNQKWKATFDWLIESPNNCAKVIEGNYDNKEQTNYDDLPF